jgi:hypothetical protein
MKKDFFCDQGRDLVDCPDSCQNLMGCLYNADKKFSLKLKHLKHKWPTPKQFEEDYGFEPPENIGCYFLQRKQGCDDVVWYPNRYGLVMKYRDIVIACTPYGCPDNDWRPE